MTLPEKLRAAAEIEMSRWGGPAKLLKEAAERIEELEHLLSIEREHRKQEPLF